MAYCSRCNKEFDPDEARDYFESETFMLSYENFKEELCGECAVEVIEEKEEGYYFERCEECGKNFDLIEEEDFYSSQYPSYNGTDLIDCWNEYNKVLCAECALNADQESFYDQEDDEDDDEDEEDLTVEEAAQIWASHGKDEDYMFGYSEDELEDAL